MDVYLMQFKKRENSTLQPTISFQPFSGTLRESCSIINPSIGFDLGQNTTPIANYAYIPTFSRYYFIENWTWERGIWWAEMAVDVLASWRSDIGSSNNYVLRAAAASNGYVEDSYYPMTREHATAYSIIQTPWTYNRPGSGYYIVGIISNDINAIGAVAYYAFTALEFRGFMSAMLTTPNWTNVDFTSGEISEDFFKSIFNPFQYVVSAIWLPFAPDLSTQVTAIPFGWWSLSANAHLILNSTWIQDRVVSLPKHPQSAGRGAFLNGTPYTRMSLVFQPYGLIELDPNLYINATECTISVMVDVFTGIGTLTIKPGGSGADNPLDVLMTAQVGVPIQLAQVSSDYIGAVRGLAGGISGVAGGIGGALTGNIIGGITNTISSAITGIVDAAASMIPHVSSSGANGSFMPFVWGATLFCDFFKVVDEDRSHRGRPVCGVYQLSQLSGFQMILDPDISINGTDEECRRIKSYLATGYYWE